MGKANVAAGLLLFHQTPDGLRFLLAHPGGPLFQKKDEGHWTLPKGEPDPGEDDLSAVARREFAEETGWPVPEGAVFPIGRIKQKGGKIVHGFAIEADWPANREARSNTFSMEWPPRSGQQQDFPEVDRIELFSEAEARRKIKPAQLPFIEAVIEESY